uniref:UBC core domain-containing protein n=1 Tax=Brassica campestris TaxID=3711 RepID=M4D980_BRACM
MELMLVVVVPKKRDFVTALLIARRSCLLNTLQFARLEDARNALNLNGQLEIAGRAIKNNGDLDDDDGQVLVSSFLKLANLSSKREHISSPRCSAISIGGSSRKRGFSAVVGIPAVVDPVGAPSECLLLKNMFDPSTETEPEFDFDEHIKEDVKDECSKFGELNHIFVDKNSIGFLSTCHLKMRKQQWECNVLSMMEHEQDDPGVDLPLDGSLESEPICDDPSRIDKADDSGSNEHPNIYRHDIVRNNKTGSIGVVSEVAGDSDSESDISDEENYGGDDEDDDNDDDGAEEEGKKANEENVGRGEKNYKCGTLEGDQIRVLWMDDTEPVQDVNNVTVVDRGFLHGDYVASSSDPTGQVGVVVDVDMSVDLLALDGSTHKDISTKELKRVRDFCVGDYVVHGPWLGRIDDVLDNVTVLFDDGSMCRVLRAEPLQLKPVSQSNLEEDANFPYYPGQRVKATSSSVFKSSRWLSGLWKPNRLEGTVTKVTAGSIFVYWIASAGFGPDSAVSPPEEQSPSNLTLLSSFTHANWQVGDWGLLPSVNQSATIPLHKHVSKLRLYDSQAKRADREQNKSDLEDELSEEKSEPVGITAEALPKETTVSSTSKEPAHEPWPLHRKKIRKLVIRKDKRVKKKEESFERALLIVNSRTLVDVAWQDGTVECRREATTLIPIETPGDQEFVPEQYVVEKASDDDDNNTTEPKRVGVVKSVNAKERTASVRWLKPRLTAEEPREFDKEEIASVYELEVHPDYDYCYGDVVVRLSPVTMALPASSEATEQDDGHQDAEYHQEAKVHDKEENEVDTNIPELSWVGNITGLKDGDIEVTWADGMVSTVGPQAIYVVGRDDDESIAAESEASDAASWETVDDDNGGAPEEDLGRGSFLEENSDAGNNGENDSGRNGALALPLAAVEFVTRMASGIFSRGQKAEDSSSSSLTDDNGLTNSSHERGSFLDDHSPTNFSATDNCDLEGTVVENEAVERSEGEKSEEPIPSESDSCSFKRFDISQDPLDHHYLGSDEQKTKERRWFKKVDQDWKILQNNLPDGIFVRVYEDRMDLLRAVIAGAYGTPYQDGLFFFDFHLPSDYPSVPPSAHYHSGGWRLNPNLYEEGKGLVLNSKPYFNEAGYDKQIGTAEGEKNSLGYNENAFLLNCKTMMYLMRRPPKDFEELIKDHFRKRGYYILKACDAYMKGYLIGSLSKDASVIDESCSANSNSVGFKLMLAKIAPKLFSALSEVGADCNEFKHLQQQQ